MSSPVMPDVDEAIDNGVSALESVFESQDSFACLDSNQSKPRGHKQSDIWSTFSTDPNALLFKSSVCRYCNL